ncbi:MAG: ABC transporter substrate-binding protein [Acidimicrobiales bacterium]
MTHLRGQWRFLLVCVVATATLATACGSGDDPSATGEVDDVDLDSDSSDSGGEDTSDPATAEDASGDETEADDSTTTEPLELTDSFRGVTATTIKVGVVAPDLEALQGLVDLDHGSYEAAYRALFEEVNANGGINGREVEVVFEPFLPVGTEAMDTICARLTQDEEVFAVVGDLQNDGPLCYTELSDTAVVGSTQNDDRVAASAAPWFSAFRNSDNVTETIIRGFDAEGIFDGETVGVVAGAADQDAVEAKALPLLDELGVDVVDVAFIEASPLDTVAAEAETSLIAEKQESEGVTLALAIGASSPIYAGGLEQVSYRPQVAATSLSSLRGYIRDRGGRDLSVLEGAVAGNTAEQLGWWDDPAVQDCIATVEAAGEPTILDPNTRLPDEPENLVSVAAACRNIALFVAIATAAGADLTNDTFRAAGEGLGEFHVPGLGPGTYSATTPDGRVPVYFFEWDAAIDDLSSDGTTL